MFDVIIDVGVFRVVSLSVLVVLFNFVLPKWYLCVCWGKGVLADAPLLLPIAVLPVNLGLTSVLD
jgi:hypothetical protein